MRIMGHKTDAGVVEDEDVIEAGAKLDAAFEAVLGNRNGDRNDGPAGLPMLRTQVCPSRRISWKKLSSLPGEKLKALVALLGCLKA